MKRISVEPGDHGLLKALEASEGEDVLILRDGRPVGVMTSFVTEDDWLDYQIEHDPAFLRDIAAAREDVRAGRTIPLDEAFARIDAEEKDAAAKRRAG